MKIFIATSKHFANDARIYQKQAEVLSNIHSVKYYHRDSFNRDIGFFISKEKNFFYEIIRHIKFHNPDILILHDFDLIAKFSFYRPVSVKIIADIHEDYPVQIKYKPYLNRYLANFLSFLLKMIFPFMLSQFNGVIYATKYIFDKYQPRVSSKQAYIRNLPQLRPFFMHRSEVRRIDILYIGGMSTNRGMAYIAEIAKRTKFRIVCAGPCYDDVSKKHLNDLVNIRNFDYLGVLPYDEIYKLVGKSKIGLVPLLPIENYLKSTPVKMFEYIAGGAYTLASDFPFWCDKYSNLPGLEFVSFSDTEGVIHKLEQLLDNDNLNDFPSLSPSYSWESESYRFLQFIQDFN